MSPVVISTNVINPRWCNKCQSCNCSIFTSRRKSDHVGTMAISRSCNSSLNFEVLLLFLLCLYAIFPSSKLHIESSKRHICFSKGTCHGIRKQQETFEFASLISSWPKDTSSSFESLNFHEMWSLKVHRLLLLHARMLWGCPGEPWTCCQLYSGRFFYCNIKRQERHYDRSHKRSRPLHKFNLSEATGFQYQFGCPCYF